MDYSRVHESPPQHLSASDLAGLGRDELIDRLLHFNGKCRLDFNEGFLQSKTTDRLRHILMAAYQYAARCE